MVHIQNIQNFIHFFHFEKTITEGDLIHPNTHICPGMRSFAMKKSTRKV